MIRYLSNIINEDALPSKKMAFISGPRQVGKTTIAKSLLKDEKNYFNWDQSTTRRSWAKDSVAMLENCSVGPVVLDEIHKDRRWKQRLKGVYDTIGNRLPIIVTGSARLDYYRKSGDSLLGRYIPYRLHPFTVAEQGETISPEQIGTPRVSTFKFDDLMKLGGFPEPLLAGSEAKAKRWSRLRMERLLTEDVRDLRVVQDLEALRTLCDFLPLGIGSLLSINNLRENVGVAYATVREWIKVLEALYVSFLVRPYAGKLSRMVKADPKLYLFDILHIDDPAARRENLVALHLLKACQYWTDTAQGDFTLHFVRDKDGNEVDFLIVKDKKPWALIECKTNDVEVSPALTKFSRKFKCKHCFQLVSKKDDDRANSTKAIRVMNIERFLSSLI